MVETQAEQEVLTVTHLDCWPFATANGTEYAEFALKEF